MNPRNSHSIAGGEAVKPTRESANTPLGVRNSIAFSINDAAAALGMSRWWIHEQMKLGNLPYRKIGRRTFIMRADLETFMDQFPTRCGRPTEAA